MHYPSSSHSECLPWIAILSGPLNSSYSPGKAYHNSTLYNGTELPFLTFRCALLRGPNGERKILKIDEIFMNCICSAHSTHSTHGVAHFVFFLVFWKEQNTRSTPVALFIHLFMKRRICVCAGGRSSQQQQQPQKRNGFIFLTITQNPRWVSHAPLRTLRHNTRGS